LVLLAAPLWGQGRTDAPNYESTHVRPITVARVNGHDYLLVCNTPDNSVEIYDTVGNTFLMRIPVGQGPVSVVYRNKLKRFYTANFLGDSISMVKLDASTGTLNATFEQTVAVPDEPWHITFYTQTLAQPIETHEEITAIDLTGQHRPRAVVILESVPFGEGLIRGTAPCLEPHKKEDDRGERDQKRSQHQEDFGISRHA